MDFSYSYNNTMQRFSRTGGSLPNYSEVPMSSVSSCPMEMCFKLSKSGGEIPICAYDNCLNILRRDRHMLDSSYITIVVPLIENSYSVRTCTGADTILKSFTNRYGRLDKTVTPKGEVYYGALGVVLDKEYRPLIYLTKTAVYDASQDFYPDCLSKTKVHISPLVFTDDVSVVNKSILKKGIAYYLTHKIGGWGTEEYAEVVIDDGSWLFRKPTKPSPSDDIKENTNLILKDDIAEILEQIKDDIRGF